VLERAQHLAKDGNAGVVEGWRHGVSPVVGKTGVAGRLQQLSAAATNAPKARPIATQARQAWLTCPQSPCGAAQPAGGPGSIDRFAQAAVATGRALRAATPTPTSAAETTLSASV